MLEVARWLKGRGIVRMTKPQSGKASPLVRLSPAATPAAVFGVPTSQSEMTRETLSVTPIEAIDAVDPRFGISLSLSLIPIYARSPT